MIEITRPVKRISAATVRHLGTMRPVVIELDPTRPNLIGFRLKGTRKVWYLPVDYCFRESIRNELARIKAERARARKEKAKR